jgi:hypothetical protein
MKEGIDGEGEDDFMNNFNVLKSLSSLNWQD